MRISLLTALLIACSSPATPEAACEEGVDCPEECADTTDNDGDGAIDCEDDDCAEVEACDRDRDDDGHEGTEWGGDDCNDGNPAIYPGNLEVCDGFDNDCNGLTDDEDPDVDPASFLDWHRDDDGDGYGSPQGAPQQACQGPSGSADNDEDCNDNDADRHPAATEICNNIDDDCDGDVDDDDPDVDLTGAETFYMDADGDTDGDANQSTTACERPDGYSPANTDCDDSDPAVHGRDVDGDGTSSCDGDCDDDDANLNVDDDDADGFSTCDGDCDDNDGGANPGAVEIPGDCIDQDCDGQTGDVGCQFEFDVYQMIDGMDVTCSSVVQDPLYTQCNDLLAGGLYFPNGISCGPLWSSTPSPYTDHAGFCQSLTGSPTFEVYYACTYSQPRATWYANVWANFNDNGYSEDVRCYY